MANTIAILEQGGNSGTAAEYAFGYVNGGKGDWHLPSKDELNELFKQRITVGGIALDASSFFWSSSEQFAAGTWVQHFLGGVQGYNGKMIDNRVRPVRAF